MFSWSRIQENKLRKIYILIIINMSMVTKLLNGDKIDCDQLIFV